MTSARSALADPGDDPDELLRGLAPGDEARSAAEVLEAVSWQGLAPDPDAMSAAEFLGWVLG